MFLNSPKLGAVYVSHIKILCEERSDLFRVVYWVILPCKMIVDRRFRGAYCLHHQG
jgi:hypothetical protein